MFSSFLALYKFLGFFFLTHITYKCHHVSFHFFFKIFCLLITRSPEDRKIYTHLTEAGEFVLDNSTE